MLACVVLHEAEPSLPVDLKSCRVPGPERKILPILAVYGMTDHTVIYLYISDSHHYMPVPGMGHCADPSYIR